MENEKHVSHFPAHDLVFVFKTQKGDLAADRFAPAPGSFFNEKMLTTTLKIGYCLRAPVLALKCDVKLENLPAGIVVTLVRHWQNHRWA